MQSLSYTYYYNHQIIISQLKATVDCLPAFLNKKRAALFFKVLNLFVNTFFGNLKLRRQAAYTHKFAAFTVYKFFVRAYLVKREFFTAMNTVCHYLFTTLQRYTKLSYGLMLCINVPLVTVTVSSSHTLCMQRVLPVLSGSPSSSIFILTAPSSPLKLKTPSAISPFSRKRAYALILSFQIGFSLNIWRQASS